MSSNWDLGGDLTNAEVDDSSDLEAYLSSHLMARVADASSASREEILAFWSELLGADEDRQEDLEAFEDSLLSIVGLDRAGLQIRGGTWHLDLKAAIAKGALLTAVLSGALYAAGVHDLTPALLTAVLPAVIDVRRVSVNASDRWLHAQLIMLPQARSDGLTPEELYAGLPAETRRRLFYPDFLNLLERLRGAGLAETHGEAVQLLPMEAGRFRISIKSSDADN